MLKVQSLLITSIYPRMISTQRNLVIKSYSTFILLHSHLSPYPQNILKKQNSKMTESTSSSKEFSNVGTESNNFKPPTRHLFLYHQISILKNTSLILKKMFPFSEITWLKLKLINLIWVHITLLNMKYKNLVKSQNLNYLNSIHLLSSCWDSYRVKNVLLSNAHCTHQSVKSKHWAKFPRTCNTSIP